MNMNAHYMQVLRALIQPQLLLFAFIGIVLAPWIAPLIISFDFSQILAYVGFDVQDGVLSLFLCSSEFAAASMLYANAPSWLRSFLGAGPQRILVGMLTLFVAGVACYIYQIALVDMSKDALNGATASIMRSVTLAWRRLKAVCFWVTALLFMLSFAWLATVYLGVKIFGDVQFWSTFVTQISLIMLLFYLMLIFSTYVLAYELGQLHHMVARSLRLLYEHLAHVLIVLVGMLALWSIIENMLEPLLGAYAAYLYPVVYTPLYALFVLLLTRLYIRGRNESTHIVIAHVEFNVFGR